MFTMFLRSFATVSRSRGRQRPASPPVSLAPGRPSLSLYRHLPADLSSLHFSLIVLRYSIFESHLHRGAYSNIHGRNPAHYANLNNSFDDDENLMFAFIMGISLTLMLVKLNDVVSVGSPVYSYCLKANICCSCLKLG